MSGAAEAPGDGFRGSARRWSWLGAVGIALYLAALWYIGGEKIAPVLKGIEIKWFVAMIAVEFLALSLRMLKWRLVLGASTHAVPQFFLSKGGGNLTPGRIGELSPLLSSRFRSPRVGAWIVLDRLMEAGATILFGVVGLLFVFGVSEHLALLGWSVAIACVVAALLTALLMGAGRPQIARILDRAGKLRWAAPLTRFLHSALDEGVALGPKVPGLATITLVATALDLTAGLFVLASFGEWVSMLVLAVAQGAHAVTAAVPFSPSATGIPYAAAAVVLNQAANVPAEVLAATIGVRVVMGNLMFWSCFGLAMTGLRRTHDFSDQGALFDYLAADEVLYQYDEEALRRLDWLLDHKGLTLDVGCGDGLIGQALDADVVALDISQRCARMAGNRKLKAVAGDALRGLPFASQTFDTVACIDVLHHLDQQWETLFPELDRVLKPGGHFLIVEPDARNPFVRWTQAPGSPIRVAPWPNEPAIDPAELTPHLERLGYTCTCEPVHIEGEQSVRSVFPLWQRVLKAPAVLALAFMYRGRPNKFAIVATKPA